MSRIGIVHIRIHIFLFNYVPLFLCGSIKAINKFKSVAFFIGRNFTAHVAHQPEWYFKSIVEAQCPKSMERDKGACQLLYKQVDEETRAMGLAYFNIVWAYDFL